MHCKELNISTFLITNELQVQFHKFILAHAVTLAYKYTKYMYIKPAYMHTLKGVSVAVCSNSLLNSGSSMDDDVARSIL